ncbi:MAG TPA: tetratricopeptide repeat protein, partial [Polyangiales bacterium]|nr:tetratricopeptide repeat protein [Polyangiales bacterium]
MDPIAEQLVARLRRDPNDLAAYDELKSHYNSTQDFASLANLLEGWAGANQEDWLRSADAYAQAAEASVAGREDAQRAIGLLRMALQMNALHPEAGPRLIALLEEHGDPQQLAEFLDAYARTLDSGGGSPEYVSVLFERLAQLWEHSFARPDVAADYRALAAAAGGAPPALVNTVDASARATELEQLVVSEQDPALRATQLAELADLRGQLGDVPAAIAALRHALSATPGDIAIMHRLATYLLTRAEQADELTARADHRRVAELFYQIAQGVDQEQAIEYLESALGSMPEHEGALGMLERLATQLERADILPRHWVAYVGAAGEGPDLDRRRLHLGEAYLQAGQLDDARYCLQPAAEHGNDRANELLQALYAQQATDGGDAHAAIPRDGDTPSSLPATGRPQRRTGREERDENAIKIGELRRLAHDALTARRHDEAAERCREILALDPLDAEAFNLLESHYRKRRDYPTLRELLLASTRVPGLTVDARKVRLREVATLSETKLRDSDAAMSAWRSVVTLDPSDREASASLKRLLKKGLLWDELASVLEREALATTGIDEKAGLLREIALLHRDKRKDREETAAAFSQLYALKPGDFAVRDELCELYLELERWADAASLLRARIDQSSDAIEVQKLTAQLATILHERLGDLDGAFELCERMLGQRPNDRVIFDRMERIDDQSANHDRLLKTLERRTALAPKAEKPVLFVRMGVIAEHKAHDIDRAAEYFGDALDLAPDHPDAMQHLVDMFERAGRYDQLVETLRERALMEKDAKNRAPLFRRVARVLAEKLSDEQGAAEAYRSLLAIEEDEEALRFLREIAARDDQPAELADVLRRLVALCTDANERSTLLLDLAFVLHERVERSDEAASALKRLLGSGDPVPPEAVELLLEISELAGDGAGMALALQHRLAQQTDPMARRVAAQRLADLCEGPLGDREGAIAALRQWTQDDGQNPEPLRRLRALLQDAERWAE